MSLSPELLYMIFEAYPVRKMTVEDYTRLSRVPRNRWPWYTSYDLSAISRVCKSWRRAVMPIWVGRPGHAVALASRYEIEAILRYGLDILANMKHCLLRVADERGSVDKTATLALLAACPKLVKLGIYYESQFDWVDDGKPTTTVSHSLRHFEIHYARDGFHTQALATLLPCCPQLETLKLESEIPALDVSACPESTPQSLRKLELCGWSKAPDEDDDSEDEDEQSDEDDEAPPIWDFSPSLLQNLTELVVDDPRTVFAKSHLTATMVNLTTVRVTGARTYDVDGHEEEELSMFSPLPALRHLVFASSEWPLFLLTLFGTPPQVHTIRGHGIFDDLMEEYRRSGGGYKRPANSSLRSIHLDCINDDLYCPSVDFFYEKCGPLVDELAKNGVTLELTLDETTLDDDAYAGFGFF